MPTERKKVIILGGLGNGTVIAAALDDASRPGSCVYEMAGYLNDRLPVGDDLEGHPILGRLEQIPRFIQEGYNFLYTIYRLEGQDRRLQLFENLRIPGDQLATFIHPRAYVAGNAQIGPGCVVMPHASISSGVILGKCSLVMVGATIGHNNLLGDHCHLAAQSCLGAFLKIGKGVHIGLNASVRENLTLGDDSALGMGSVLLHDVGPGEIWAGNPAKFLRYAQKEL